MNADWLLAHYERVADVPDAIPRLRRFVLDLAVRGKLEQQDPEDEPASELLSRIATEKARLVKAGEIRKPRTIEPLVPDELPFRLPSGWVWTQIAALGVINPRNEAADDHEASFVPMPMIAAEYGVGNGHDRRAWGEIRKGYTHFAEGDVGLAKITPCFENGKSTVFRNLTGGIGSGTTELHIVRPLFASADYIVLYLKTPCFIETGIPRMTGTAGQKRVPTEYFTSSPFPLPPLAEQHRIVAKVDELMVLCDRLEAAQVERESQRDRLVATSLHRLSHPAEDSSAEDIREHARFYLNHLQRLTTRLEHVKQLRQTLLDLAVAGKLVEQDPTEECAVDYLRSLDELPTATKKLLVPPDLTGSVTDIPETWSWLPLTALINGMDAGWSPQCENHPRATEEEWGVLKTTAVQPLAFSASQNKKLPTNLQPRPQYEARIGDILVTRAGPKHRVGVSCVVDVPCPKLMISDKLIRFHTLGKLSPQYIALALNAGRTLEQIEAAKSGMAVMQMNISQKKLRAISIPLPPVAEQNRIIAKVEGLMTLCNRLEAAVKESAATRHSLLDALLRHSLRSVTPELEAAE